MNVMAGRECLQSVVCLLLSNPPPRPLAMLSAYSLGGLLAPPIMYAPESGPRFWYAAHSRLSDESETHFQMK